MTEPTFTSGGNKPRSDDRLYPSFAFEHVAAKLIPFDLMTIGNQVLVTNNSRTADLRPTSQQPQSPTARQNHALAPIFETGGLVFPYNPIITEGISVNYDSIDVTHSNESYFVYKNTSNVRINISNAIWTCDTFDNAVYALSALHFFRAYSLMDFGRSGRQNGIPPSGRPPAPMWFEAYGNYAFHRVPCLLEKADWTFPNDVDYVGIPEFDTNEFLSRTLATKRTNEGRYTWLPMKFEVSSISLIVQHTPTYWLNFSLDDYRSGKMLSNNGSFHSVSRDLARTRNI